MLETTKKLEKVTNELLELVFKNCIGVDAIGRMTEDELKAIQLSSQLVNTSIELELELAKEIDSINKKLDTLLDLQKKEIQA